MENKTVNYRIDTDERTILVYKKMEDCQFAVKQVIQVPEICNFQAILNGVLQKYTGQHSRVRQEGNSTFIEHIPK